jgi:hypothetical protein
MRDTYNATELATAILPYKDEVHECRLERIFVKEDNQEEIRFSWWENGNIVPRPPDLSERELLRLFEQAIANRIFTTEFR